MNFNEWVKRYKYAVGGQYVLKYRGYTLTDKGYELGEEISRQDFEQHRQATNKVYDMSSKITIRPQLSDMTKGYFEYSSSIKEERTWEVEEACLEAFIEEYQIVDRLSLENLLEVVNAETMIYKLKALSQIPDLIRKFQ